MPAFVLTLFLTAGLVQPAAPITGVVLDPSGSAVPDAIVRLEVGGTTIHEMQTATDGRFAFPARRRPPCARHRDGRRLRAGHGRRGRRVERRAADHARAGAILRGGERHLVAHRRAACGSDRHGHRHSRVRAAERRGGVDRRRAEDGAGIHALPPHLVARLESNGPGHLASRPWRHRRQPVAGAGQRHPAERRVRRLGLLGQGAAGGDRSHRSAARKRHRSVRRRRGRRRRADPDGASGPSAGARGARGRQHGYGPRVDRSAAAARADWCTAPAGNGSRPAATFPWPSNRMPGLRRAAPSTRSSPPQHTLGARDARLPGGEWMARSTPRGSVFDEDRENGTPVADQLDGVAAASPSTSAGGVGGGLLSLRGFGGTQGYVQTFSAVNATRTLEALNRIQRVPTEVVGLRRASGCSRSVGIRCCVGAETRLIEGTTIETPYTVQNLEAGIIIAQPTTRAGGTQRLGSGFAQATLNLNDRLTVVARRAGDWLAHASPPIPATTRRSARSIRAASFTYRLDVKAWRSVALRTRASARRRSTSSTAASASGNTQTNPNEALLPERLTGGDGGVLISRGARLGARSPASGTSSTMPSRTSRCRARRR